MAWDFGSTGMAWFGNISEKFDNLCSDMDGVNCQDSLRYVGNQLVAVGTHVVEFWSEILQDVQVKEKEVPDLSDSQTPTAGVDKEELSNVSPLPKVNFEEPNRELHSDSSLCQNAVVSNEESCWDTAKLSSMLSFEIIEFNSSTKGENSKPLDVNAEVSSDLRAIINSCESKFSDSGVSSDDVLSTFSIDIHAPVMSEESYGSEFELCDESVESERTERHSDSGESNVASTKEVMDQEDACAKVLIVNPAEYATTETVKDHNVTKEGRDTDQSKLNKLEVDESLILADSNESCSVCDLEKIIPASVKFVEKKEFEQQNQPEDLDAEQNQTGGGDSNIPSLPSLEWVSLDDEFCESEWVVV